MPTTAGPLGALGLGILIVFAPDSGAPQETRGLVVETENVAADVQALTNFSALPGISTAQFDIDDTGNPQIETYKIPFSDERMVEGLGIPVYREVNVGYLRASQSLETDDLSLDATFQAGSIYGGAGFGFDVEGVHIRPIVSLSYAYLRNQTEFGGPLGDRIGAEVEGILADFGVSAVTIGGSLDLAYEVEEGDYAVELGARFNRLLTTSLFGTTDALEGTAVSNVLTTRYIVKGPIGTVGPVPFRFLLNLANTTLFGAQRSALGFPFFIEIGGGIDIGLPELANSVGLRGSVIRGERVEGFSIGLTAEF